MIVAFIGFSMLFPHTPNVDDPLSEEKIRIEILRRPILLLCP